MLNARIWQQTAVFVCCCDGAAYVARLRMLLTAVSDQGAPRALGTPRALSARATPRSVVTPLACISRIMGRTFAAKRSALALLAAVPSACPNDLLFIVMSLLSCPGLLVQLSGRNSRNASMTGTSPRASVSDTRSGSSRSCQALKHTAQRHLPNAYLSWVSRTHRCRPPAYPLEPAVPSPPARHHQVQPAPPSAERSCGRQDRISPDT